MGGSWDGGLTGDLSSPSQPTPTAGRIAEDRLNCELISKEEAAVQQLVLMALSENEVVVRQACKTIGGLGHHRMDDLP